MFDPDNLDYDSVKRKKNNALTVFFITCLIMLSLVAVGANKLFSLIKEHQCDKNTMQVQKNTKQVQKNTKG